MKLLLLTFVVCFAAALAAPADKSKRDILPGDPRYGTEYDHHPHHEHENEVQIGKAVGGYVGSYAVHDESQLAEDQPQLHSAYGLPTTVAQPLGSDFITTSDNAKSTIEQVPSTSYGIPDTQTTVKEQSKYDVVQKSVIPEHHHVHQPAIVNKHVETISVPQVKVGTSLPVETQGVFRHSVPSFTSSKTSPTTFTSYSNIPVKTVDTHVQVQIPQPYAVPVTKHVPYPIAVPHRVDVPKPYYVRVPHPVQVPVNHPYPVEIPRPVPYPVAQYVRTTVPALSTYQLVQPHHVTLDAIRASNNPFQGFYENAQVQNVLANLPSYQNSFENLQNPFESLQNFELPSFPGLPSFPSFPSLPSPQQPSKHVNNEVTSATSGDAVAVDNLALKIEKPKFKPATACAGCSVGAVNTGSASGSASAASSGVAFTTKQQNHAHEHVQAIDANGGYIY